MFPHRAQDYTVWRVDVRCPEFADTSHGNNINYDYEENYVNQIRWCKEIKMKYVYIVFTEILCRYINRDLDYID